MKYTANFIGTVSMCITRLTQFQGQSLEHMEKKCLKPYMWGHFCSVPK